MDYQNMVFADIVDWCTANNQTKWLKDYAASKNNKITFIALKRAFVDKFMPEIAPKAKPKKPTMVDIIANL